MPLIAALVPRFFAYAPGVVGLGTVLAGYFIYKRRFALLHPALLIVAGIALLAALSTFWSVDPDVTWGRTIKVALVILPGALLVIAAGVMERDRRFFWFSAALGLGFLLMTVEIFGDFPFYHMVRGLPFDVAVPTKSVANRSIVALVLLLFPALGVVMAQPDWSACKRWVVAGALVLLFMPCFGKTESQSAQLGFIVGMLFAAMPSFIYRARMAWIVLAALIAVGITAMPWIVMTAFEIGASAVDASSLLGDGGAYGGERLEIWDFVAREALKNPLLGHGVGTTRIIEFDTNKIYFPGSSVLHPHNFALQLWLELGLVGVLAGIAVVLYLLKAMYSHLSVSQNRIALPTLMAGIAMALTSYGLWQSWWLGLFLLATACVILAVRLMEGDKE